MTPKSSKSQKFPKPSKKSYPLISVTIASGLAVAISLWVFDHSPLVSTVRAEGQRNCLPSIWGGKNEMTTYAPPYVPSLSTSRKGGTTGAEPVPYTLNAPVGDGMAVRTSTYGTITVPQATIPGDPATGAVGMIDRPATEGYLGATGSEGQGQILYVLPGIEPEVEPLRPNSGIAVASDVVPAGTPGAIPVAVKERTVYRPVSEYHWVFDRTSNTRLVRVEVVNPRTGRVVGCYYEQEEIRSILPVPHVKETVHFQKEVLPVATPVRSQRQPYRQSVAPAGGAFSPLPSGDGAASATTLVN